MLSLALFGCSERGDPPGPARAVEAADAPAGGSAPAGAPADTGKSVLETMADLGFEPARKEARVPFELSAMDGTTRTLDDYAGSYVLLNFWATWCAPCRIEMPALERLHQELADRGLRVVGVDVGEETDDVKRFVEETASPSRS